nr:iron chelate uptake ABC transporter family permease subunit [Actinomyces johnsonii]
MGELASAFTPGKRSVASIIVWQLRMPRTALAVMVGSSLAVAGVVMQGLTRNPLAEPGILGVNARGPPWRWSCRCPCWGSPTPAAFSGSPSQAPPWRRSSFTSWRVVAPTPDPPGSCWPA